MTQLRISECAELLGVSDDTIRRWADAGRLVSSKKDGHLVIDASSLAALAAANAHAPEPGTIVAASARNRLKGIVTKVTKDTVMAQVEIQAGPFRVVSLLSREAVDAMGLEPGSIAVASIKATNVVVESPGESK